MSEFDLIAKYFTWDVSAKKSKNIIKNVGDDAAVLSLAADQQLVTSIDTLVSGVHFPETTSAFDIGYKALAVNLSDLAAMGAKPEWFTLALTLPEIDHDWLSEFSHGLKLLAEEYGIALVGGDTSSGPLTISIQVMGSVDQGKAILRSGAKIGDKLYLTGYLGDGAAGLLSIQNKISLDKESQKYLQRRLNRPTPRLKESQLLKDFATACIDISDGLLQDLRHILDESNKNQTGKTLGAQIDTDKIPFSEALKKNNIENVLALALAGGDDYELLFTIPKQTEVDFLQRVDKSPYQFTCIGEITHDSAIVNCQKQVLDIKGFDHFL